MDSFIQKQLDAAKRRFLTEETYIHTEEAKRLGSLKHVTKESIKEDFSFEGMIVLCKIVDAYDADSCRPAFYMGDRLIRFQTRLMDIDTPEMYPRNASSEELKELEKRAARLARAELIMLVTGGTGKIDDHENLVVAKFGENGKYGRPLVTLFEKTDQAPEYYNDFHNSINYKLIKDGYALPYDGGKKPVFDFSVYPKAIQ